MRGRVVRTRSIALVLLASLLAACAGEAKDEQLLTEETLPRVVLQPADLTGSWTRFDEGRQLRADALPGRRGDTARFDRQDGWKARYRRPGSPDTAGPLVIESRADLFADVSGAEEDFGAAIEDLERVAAPSRPVEVVELGDEARSVESGSSEAGQFKTVTIVWREQNVVAMLTANGFSGKLASADVVALARKQQQRLVRTFE